MHLIGKIEMNALLDFKIVSAYADIFILKLTRNNICRCQKWHHKCIKTESFDKTGHMIKNVLKPWIYT